MYEYKAEVINVVDGDTFDAIVDLGFEIQTRKRFRVANLDTPEVRTKNVEEKKHGKEATKKAKELILGKVVTVKSDKTGKYGRYIAKVTLPGGEDLAEVMINEGFSKKESYGT